MSSSDDLKILSSAIKTVTDATERNRLHDYEEAYILYQKSLELFEQSMKEEMPSDSKKVVVQAKCKSYQERAEEIRKFLNMERCLNTVISVANQAVDKDNADNYMEAMELYEKAYFMATIVCQMTDIVSVTGTEKTSVMAKGREYLDRADKIRIVLEQRNYSY